MSLICPFNTEVLAPSSGIAAEGKSNLAPTTPTSVTSVTLSANYHTADADDAADEED